MKVLEKDTFPLLRENKINLSPFLENINDFERAVKKFYRRIKNLKNLETNDLE